MNSPKEAKLIQESLAKVTEGPEALMQWAQNRRGQIDARFVNTLGKMVKYAEKTDKPEISKTLGFLKTCFDKMFDFPDEEASMAITQDNFRQVWQEAAMYLCEGKPQRALAVMGELSLFFSQHPEIKCEPLLSANLGIAYAQLNQKERAVEYLQNSLAGDLQESVREKVLANLGTVCMGSKNLPQAMDCYLQALTIARRRNDLSMQIIHLNNLALICMESENLSQAVIHQQLASELAERMEDRKVLQDTLTRLALLVKLQGDYKKCEQLCKRALDLTPEK